MAESKKTVKTEPKKTFKAAPQTASTTILKEGAKAPAVSTVDETGEKKSLTDFKGKTVVLYFYPKDDTPGCTKEACDFRDSFNRLKKQDVAVLGVSKDSVKSHLKFKEKYGLNFPLLSDESGKISEAYGVWKEKSMYGRKYMGIERTTYIVDVDAAGKGKIRKIYPKVSVTGHVDQILADLKS